MTHVQAGELKIGDTTLPPAREIRLWMSRRLQEKNLPESVLYLTITDIQEAQPDKKGRWLLITVKWLTDYVDQTPKRYPFKFKIRPETPWPRISADVNAMTRHEFAKHCFALQK